MATLESLRRQVDATEDLQAVVRTMKALAAVRIRQFQEASAALRDYRRTAELGLRAVLRHAQTRRGVGERNAPAALLVVGSDQGMCGQFNEDVGRHARQVLRRRAPDGGAWLILAIGTKVTPSLAQGGHSVAETHDVPSSVETVTEHVRGLLAVVEGWQAEHGALRRVMLVHNRPAAHAVEAVDRQLLPMDQDWLGQLREQPWPTEMLPQFSCPADELLSHLVRQYLFGELYGALVDSLAAENATRLRAMQSAEKNVEERLDELSTRYHRERQNSITAELLDVITGSEAVASV